MPKKSSKTLPYSGVETTFAQKVYAIVSRIPRGETRTYGVVAKAAGRPGAARAVGTIMSKNRDTKRVPCHRVVRADGQVGDYAFGGPAKKRALLKREGALS